ncbi:MAG TPA: hypothetical protein VM096_16805 [Vicinamibacterales bacterium]|nr:hypothetical protein [Vicinamibacterales bacterium]
MNMRLRLPVLVATIALACSSFAAAQGTKPAPKTAKPPAKTAPATKKPPAAPVAAAAPAPAPPSDVRYKAKYTAVEQVTESTSFFTDNRERYELGDIVLIKQRDQKRNLQISRAANTYVIIPDSAPAAATPAAPKPPGVVTVSTSIVDLGDRKDLFGRTARHVRTLIERLPEPGACDQTKLRSDTDAWYIDLPKAIAAAPDPPKPTGSPSGCLDEIKTNETGDAKLLGFPISYHTTLTDLGDKDAKPTEASMEIIEFDVLKLDKDLFDIPPGLAMAADASAFTKAVSDANEAKLASGGADASIPAKKPGTLRVGVPEVANKTTQTIDTRALRSRIISELEEQKIEAIPMAAAPQAALDARAKELGVDYLVMAEVTELKTSKPGGFTKVMKATAKEEARDITEAKLSMQLVPPGGGKPRVAKSSSGKDGGVGLKTGLKVAKFAGSVYLKFYMGGMLMGQMSALSSLQQMNLGGMGSMGSMMPMGYGGSVDRTAGAANFVMQNVMAGAAAGAAAQGGPSFDAALENAIEDGGKDVIDSLKKAAATKK